MHCQYLSAVARTACVLIAAMGGVLQADLVDTTDPTVVTTFQTGATVVSFESVTGKTPFSISNYDSGVAVPDTATIFDQITGVQFSVGGAPGTNEPALYKLSGAIAGDAKSPTTVLGPVDFDFTTKFNNQGLIEIFFPTKVSRVGFWLNPSLGNVTIIAADTNFAFSHETETQLETGTGTAGHFVGFSRATADIGGFKIEAKGATGFTIDDFTFGGTGSTSTVPEPSLVFLTGLGLFGLVTASKLRKRA